MGDEFNIACGANRAKSVFGEVIVEYDGKVRYQKPTLETLTVEVINGGSSSPQESDNGFLS